MSMYEIIHNPQNILLKHEVWYAGEVDSQDAEGFRIKTPVVQKVKKFRTEQAATGYIAYQLEVRSFREKAQTSFPKAPVKSISKVA